MEPVFRLITPADLPALRHVQAEAAAHLLRSEGRDPGRFRQLLAVPPEAYHVLEHDPACCWLAEVDGRPVGYATGIVRGRLWYLSNLFVRPAFHNDGLGKEVLRRSMEAGARAGATVFAVLSSSYRAAQSIYLRAGMAARTPVYILTGPTPALLSLAPARADWRQPSACPEWLDRLRQLDQAVWAGPRDVDQRFWLTEARCFALQDEAQVLGYVYVRKDGRVGPLAALEPEIQLPLLRQAGQWLMDHSDEPPRLQVPGLNLAVLRPLLERGFAIETQNTLMSSRPFGQMDRYIISGGVLL